MRLAVPSRGRMSFRALEQTSDPSRLGACGQQKVTIAGQEELSSIVNELVF